MRIIRVVSIFLSWLLMFLPSCHQQQSGWKGTVREVGGVTVLNNPIEPMFGEEIFSLSEELIIGGSEGPEEYIFSNVPSVATDEEGRIYVLDYLSAHVRLYDENGKHVRTIGRKGQGPGEIGRAAFVSVTPENELMVVDSGNRRLAYFSSGGQFLKNIPSAGINLMKAEIDSDGNICAFCYVREGNEMRSELKRFDTDWTLLDFIASSPMADASRDGYILFFPGLIWDVFNGNQIVFGHQKDYELYIHDAKGLRQKIIRKKYSPVKVTWDYVEELFEGEEPPSQIKNMSLPDYHFPFQRIISDDEGRIFVMTFERRSHSNGYYYDVFNREGKFIVKILLKTRPLLLKNHKLFTVEEDEDGFPLVKRYGVTWNL